MSTAELRAELAVAEDRARSLKTKKAKTKAWDKVRGIRRQILEILYVECAKFEKHSIKGTVSRWYQGIGDHYLVTTAEYGNMWLSPASDVLTKSWYAGTCCIEYTQGQTVIIECTVEVNYDRLALNVVPGHVTGGTVNETQYAELCKKGNLAFFKYPDGHMSGLFAQPKAVSNE